MRKLLIVMAMGCLLALPAAAAAKPTKADRSQAQKICRAERANLGATLFRQTYGTNKNRRNAFGKCVSKKAKAVESARKNAAKECKDERALDPAAFAAKYGTGKNGRNAFGKCVSQKAKEKIEGLQQADENAAQQCKAERALDPAAFKDHYGTNANKRNAFGKCVSQKAKQHAAGP